MSISLYQACGEPHPDQLPTGTSGLPAELGEFAMQVSACGKPPGWWITAEP